MVGKIITDGRSANELIRGPKLAMLVTRPDRVPFVEGLRMANEANRVIASNARLSKALVKSDEWMEMGVFPFCWTGTMTAYAKPDERLGATVEYTDPVTQKKWVFRVPKEYRGEKNAILVAEHPDYKVEMDGRNIVVHAEVIDLVPNFPRKQGCYLTHHTNAKHDIPTGKKLDYPSPSAAIWSGRLVYPIICRYLERIDLRVGPVLRDNWIIVNLAHSPSEGFGMAVEAREVDEGGRLNNLRLRH